MTKECRIVTCDRCGKRVVLDLIDEKELYGRVYQCVPGDWLIFRGMDLCPDCSKVLDSVLDILFKNEKGKNAKTFGELFEAFKEALVELHIKEIDRAVLNSVTENTTLDTTNDRLEHSIPSVWPETNDTKTHYVTTKAVLRK